MVKNKLSSLSIFFPFYNDSGTVLKQISLAYKTGATVTDDLEVIAIHGGASRDDTFAKIKEAKKLYPKLKIVDKTDNKEGYAVIKHGFLNATKDWVFYTDGDAQYVVEELPLLVAKQIETGAGVVNGYKKKRGDGFVRTFLGDLYAKFSNFIFELPIRDTDCDFRLISKKHLDKFTLESTDSSILGELIKKLEISGAKFVEIPVTHKDREYGKSNYTMWDLFREKLMGDLKLYFKIRKMKLPGSSLRIVKFGAVGVTSIVVQTALFNTLLILAKMSAPIAVIIADQVAVVTSFVLNNQITFKDKKHKLNLAMFKGFINFYLIVMVSTALQALVVFIGVSFFGKSLLVANLFFALGLILGFFWNYTMQKKIVWKISARM